MKKNLDFLNLKSYIKKILNYILECNYDWPNKKPIIKIFTDVYKILNYELNSNSNIESIYKILAINILKILQYKLNYKNIIKNNIINYSPIILKKIKKLVILLFKISNKYNKLSQVHKNNLKKNIFYEIFDYVILIIHTYIKNILMLLSGLYLYNQSPNLYKNKLKILESNIKINLEYIEMYYIHSKNLISKIKIQN